MYSFRFQDAYKVHVVLQQAYWMKCNFFFHKVISGRLDGTVESHTEWHRLTTVHAKVPKAPGLLRFSLSLSTNGITWKQPQKCSSRKVQTDGWCSSDPALGVILQSSTDNICHLYFSLCYWKWRLVAWRVLLWMWLINLQHWFGIFCSTYLSLVSSLTHVNSNCCVLPMYFGGFEHSDLETREDFGYASGWKKDRLPYFQKIDRCAKMCWSPKSCAQVSIFK